MKGKGRFGDFGGMFAPEILVTPLLQLEKELERALKDSAFLKELNDLLRHYAGRPTPLYRCRRFCGASGSTIYLKREDLVHGGAHKTNQVLGQALLAKRMGKTRLIAETGAGQHGVATAIAGALLGLETSVYMGAKDVERQKLNVFRMRLLGAKVHSVQSGGKTLKDAINEAMRDWSASYEHSHYLLGTAAGPHPFPTMVREFQRVIGDEIRAQILESEGRLPDAVIACVGGGSNAIGAFTAFLNDEEVQLIGVEPGGEGLQSKKHGATLLEGSMGILHGAYTKILQDDDGQILDTHSVSAGLDYPGVGPEHVYLQSSNRAQYVAITDEEALNAFQELSQMEGIIPAFESAHALAYAMKLAKEKKQVLVVNVSGRGDKDMASAENLLGHKMTDVQIVGEERAL